MTRLPFLVVIAHWIGQRGRLYEGQVACVLEHLRDISDRDLRSVLGQLADDSAKELVTHLRNLKAEDISHFPLQCARVLAAAKDAMSVEQYHQYVGDIRAMTKAVRASVPWHGRLRRSFDKRLPLDPRRTLLRALQEAVPVKSTAPQSTPN